MTDSAATSPQKSLIETRGAQMFPTLEPAEIARLQRFGERQRFAAGEAIMRTGDAGHGLAIVLGGAVEVAQRDKHGGTTPIVTHLPGGFVGELAQLSGRPALVDAVAARDAEVLAIRPERLRAVLTAEAMLGERIMRALILRRVGLIESGAGPVIVGPAGHPGVLRLENFLRRNGHPHQHLDPGEDNCAGTLLARFEVAPEELPLVLCPGGQMLRNPDEAALARCLGMVGPMWDPLESTCRHASLSIL